MFEGTIDSFINHELENQINVKGYSILQDDLLQFQHDGPPPHYFLPAQKWLIERSTDQ